MWWRMVAAKGFSSSTIGEQLLQALEDGFGVDSGLHKQSQANKHWAQRHGRVGHVFHVDRQRASKQPKVQGIRMPHR